MTLDGAAPQIAHVLLDVATEPIVAAGGHRHLGRALELPSRLCGDGGRVDDAKRVLRHPVEDTQQIAPRRLADGVLIAHVESPRLPADERSIHVEERGAHRPAFVAHSKPG